MTISEATCCEECPYFTSSKTKVQNANRPEVRLHKMDAKLLSNQVIILMLEKTMSKALSEECQDRPTPCSFSTNVKVDPTPISLLRQKSKTPNFSQTAFNCSLRKTATMREMKSSAVLCDLYCPRVRISHPLMQLLVSTRHWSVHSATNYISPYQLMKLAKFSPFLYTQYSINNTNVSTRGFPCHDSAMIITIASPQHFLLHNSSIVWTTVWKWLCCSRSFCNNGVTSRHHISTGLPATQSFQNLHDLSNIFTIKLDI